MLILAAKTRDFKNIVIYQVDHGLDADGFYVTEFIINGDSLRSKTSASLVDRAGPTYRFCVDYALLEKNNVDLNSIKETAEVGGLSSLLHLAATTPGAPFECAGCHRTADPSSATTNIAFWSASNLQCTRAAAMAGIFPQP